MTEEFDALRAFDISGAIQLALLLLILGLIAEGGIRLLRRWATSKKWRYMSVVLNALVWQPLFPSHANDDTPAWSPDGQRIAFASDRANQGELSPIGSYRIYIYNLDSGRLIAVTHGNRDGRYPAWRPRR